MRYVAKAALFAAIVLLPALAHAQSVTGIVRDASGAVLPGVTVEAASPALLEKVRTATTDGTGQYRIENLTPGTYLALCFVTDPATGAPHAMEGMATTFTVA